MMEGKMGSSNWVEDALPGRKKKRLWEVEPLTELDEVQEHLPSRSFMASLRGVAISTKLISTVNSFWVTIKANKLRLVLKMK